jgi:hypothetical protein
MTFWCGSGSGSGSCFRLTRIRDTAKKTRVFMPRNLDQKCRSRIPSLVWAGPAGPVRGNAGPLLAGRGGAAAGQAGPAVFGHGAGGILHQQTGRRVRHHQAQGGSGHSFIFFQVSPQEPGLWIRNRIHMFLGLLDPTSDPDPSVIKQK